MINFKDIYIDKKTYNTLNNLEEKYPINNKIDTYKNLVSFKDNYSMNLHSWFKYREGFSYKLIQDLLEKENIQPNEYVLDLFCGSGTTLLEAKRQGYNSLGIDINPMSTLVSNIKLDDYKIEVIEDIKYILSKISLDKTFYSNKELENYFYAEHLSDLLCMKKHIDNTNGTVKNILFIAFLSIIEESSNRKKDGNGLRIRESKVKNVKEHLENKIYSMINEIDMGENELLNKALLGDSTNIMDKISSYNHRYNIKTGTIIFSPPYLNGFDYFESYKLELCLGGFVESMKDIKELRNQAFKSFTNIKKNDYDIPEIIKCITDELSLSIQTEEKNRGKRVWQRKVPNMIEGYFYDMNKILEQCSQLLTKNQRCYINIDQNAYLGKIIPTDLLIAYLAEEHHFTVDEIMVCRKSRTSAQQLKRYPYLSKYLRESIVVLKRK